MSAAWASPSSRGMWGGDALLLSTEQLLFQTEPNFSYLCAVASRQRRHEAVRVSNARCRLHLKVTRQVLASPSQI